MYAVAGTLNANHPKLERYVEAFCRILEPETPWVDLACKGRGFWNDYTDDIQEWTIHNDRAAEAPY